MTKETLSVTCPGCGMRNELGRVFCSGCGKKLPASGISALQVGQTARRVRFRQGFRHWTSQVAGVLFLTVLALALWPQTHMFDVGNELAARRFRDDMSGFVQALRGSPRAFRIEQSFRQDDINAYLRDAVLKDKPDIQASLDLLPQGLRVRWVRPLWTLERWGRTWQPLLSFETLYVAEDGRLEPAASRLGHLPLPGALGGPVASFFHEQLIGRTEWSVLQQLECVSIKAGELTLALDRQGN